MLPLTIGALLCAQALVPSNPAVTTAPPTSGAVRAIGDELTDAEVLAAFESMDERKQRGVVDYLRMDLSHSERFQLQVIRFALSQSDRDPGLWPEAPPIHWFDPVEHAPGQPIARRVLEVDSKAARKMRDDLKRGIPKRRLDPGYVYDWGTGDVQRLASEQDPHRIVSNALKGFAPDLDLAEALVLRWLDDGAQRKTLAAFDNRYTDRSGNVFPEVSLYDAWASGAEIEMPDVDTLGLVHSLVPERKWDRRWVAPVPNSEHDEMYGLIGELFVPAKEHRSLREALSRCFLIAEPVMRDGFSSGHVTAFQAFWEENGSEPTKAAEALPAPKDFGDFLRDWIRRLGKDEDLLAAARGRAAALAADEVYVRGRLIAVMRDMGAFEAKGN
ncbi:hypothetical protein [Engelhardtia mirabilis]|uniref:Uncharacterized protein n=1 Tax=Engelhardtia mirabilis TaxID=2528011 RepID=A0A518BKK6_9BACT|nr:hypothetical protein Pla133_25890 [Planctomycetes bacterium Pla133]QDV01831.1 hypothetical protein Pla86_25880 [Planctomycetes bacterium Pla86]